MQDSKYILIDFNDSFVMNIVEVLFHNGITVEVINVKDLNSVCSFKAGTTFIFGPGPGSPLDYPGAIHFIERNFKRNDFYFVGICLGHQLLMTYLGHDLMKRKLPRHGIGRRIKLPKWRELFDSANETEDVVVQEYNSLVIRLKDQVKIKSLGVVDYFVDDSEVLMAKSSNFISYQFHPESIGTSSQGRFFRFLKQRKAT